MKLRLSKSIFLARFFCGLIVSSQGVFLPSIQWTPDNPQIQNLKGKVRKVRQEDGLNIWCPKDYSQLVTTQGQIRPSNLYFSLYKVDTKEEYDKCDATKGKQLLICNDPEGRSIADGEYVFLYFIERPLSENMDAYPPGRTYYFIGTSGGKDRTLQNKIGGKCSSHNMKLAIHVCRKDEKNCNVDVIDGGWSMWYKNHLTGQCERNCTNPEPQNGGNPCRGPSTMSCSQVIVNQKQEDKPTIKTTSEPTKTKETVKEIPNTDFPTQSIRKRPYVNEKTTFRTSQPVDLRDAPREGDDKDGISLSMKETVLTIIGLLVLGYIVGILQVLAVIYVRSKRCAKQPEPKAHPTRV